MTPADITAELEKFIHKDAVTELRALNVGGPRRTVAGWFDGRHLHDLARNALALTRQASGVYFTPNPVHPALLSRCPNRAEEIRGHRVRLTTDGDIVERRYLIVDLDPDRTDGSNDQPSTDGELATSMAAAVEVIEELRSAGWAWPVWMRSGNGTHLVFRLAAAVPAKMSPGHPDPLRDTLAMLGRSRFRGRDLPVRVGTDTHAAVAMVAVPGTWARKGEESADGADGADGAGRRYRPAAVLDTPDDWPAPGEVVVTGEPGESAGAGCESGESWKGATAGAGDGKRAAAGNPVKSRKGRREVVQNGTPAIFE